MFQHGNTRSPTGTKPVSNTYQLLWPKDADARSGASSGDCDDESIVCRRHALLMSQKRMNATQHLYHLFGSASRPGHLPSKLPKAEPAIRLPAEPMAWMQGHGRNGRDMLQVEAHLRQAIGKEAGQRVTDHLTEQLK
jgi:hypothetical protein